MTNMDGKSLDINAERLTQLRAIFPEVFSEDKVDFQRLKQALGEDTYVKGEHYELSWAGKSEARKEVQKQTTATLIPDRENSIDFDNAQNIFIEGENLEVLRVLQKSYFGKVKMIYIDPPYNTGNDSFVYPDNYSERQEKYNKRTGITDGEGFLNKQDLWKKNTKENGQFHSVWLSMMYPRLYLSRNLLREDGVIFISIDDNEMSNLKAICNEIFGEDNFEGHIHWRRRHNQPNDKTKMIGLVAEHILCYAKNSEFFKTTGVGKVDITGSFTNPDNDVRGAWASKPWKVGSDQSGSRYIIKSPSGKVFEENWMGEENTYKNLLNDGRIIFPKNGDGFPRKKYYRSEREEEGQCATNWWTHDEFGHNQSGNDEMTRLFGEKNIFSNPKSTKLIRGLIQISNAKEEDIILDFFAGSGSTAQAVLELNEEDNLNRKFICIQLPELLENNSEAFKNGFQTISDITKERITKVINKINNERKNNNIKNKENSFNHEQKITELFIGFISYKLADSNFKIWLSDMKGKDIIAEQLALFQQSEKLGSEHDKMFIELCLKSGLGLNVTYEKEHGIYKTKHGVWFCFEKYNSGVKNEILIHIPQKVIFLNSCFENDKELSNFQLELKENKIDLNLI